MSTSQSDPTMGLHLRESCGLIHGRQIVRVSCPQEAGEFFFLQDKKTNTLFPAQRSKQNRDKAFLFLELHPLSDLQLVVAKDSPVIEEGLTISTSDRTGIISNGKWAAEIFVGKWREGGEEDVFGAPTPIRRVRVEESAWRGRTFFDVRRGVREVSSVVVESGPVRMVVEFRATMGAAGSYFARLTFDAGADFIRVEEEFDAGPGDQIVWDFSGEDLPEEIYLLDSSAGFQTQPLHYVLDRRLARLAGWNQFSQLHDFSDGYAISFRGSDDVVGMVALKGGDWDGNSHNFVEAWTRRWFPGDPDSRRLVPPEAKADAAPSPERIASRPANRCEPHFSFEGWLHRGKRSFALVLCAKDALRSPDWNAAPPLGAFEYVADRPRYRQQQSLLRRIHAQHGMFSLEDQMARNFSWPEEATISLDAPPPWIDADQPASSQPEPDSIPARVEQMLEFLAARVFGFWEGSGSAYTNPVVSRRLAHDLLAWEWLSAHGHLTAEQKRQGRAWFAFLCHLFHSDHYYPGPASMNMGGESKSLEPAMAGMANQNFFTDVFNLPGMAAQVFHAHPDAAAWRERFAQMWNRQLNYHVYPESGVWEESHTYFHHVLQSIIPTLERRCDDGVDDGFADPAFQKLVSSAPKMLSPRDVCFGNKRHVVTLGDHGVDPHDLYRRLYRTLAHRIAPTNPHLAAQLAWAYREMDGTEPLEIEPKAPPWRNEYVQGLGYFFRAQDDLGESLMVLRCGNSWAHHHNDEGSLQFFHAGRAWIVDSAFSLPQETGARKFRADGHSRWAPRDFQPLNHLWQFNRGWITEHREDVPFPYAVAFTPVYLVESPFLPYYLPLHAPIMHWRCVVQLAPSAFLVLDRSGHPLAQTIRFHLPADAPFTVGESEPASGCRLHLRPLLGLKSAQFPATDRPTQGGEEYATREIRCECDAAPLSAILVSVESAGASPTVEQSGDRFSIIHPQFSAELLVGDPEKITLLDLKSGKQSLIHLGNTAG